MTPRAVQVHTGVELTTFDLQCTNDIIVFNTDEQETVLQLQ